MTLLYLVRHATHALVGKALVGRAPGVTLSPEGVVQAEALRARLSREPIGRVLSSSVQRARETAAILAEPHGLEVEVARDLDEIDCGEWTGMSFAMLEGDPRWQAWNNERQTETMPGGESMAAVEARVSSLLDGLADQPGPIVLVSHSDVIKAAVMALLAIPLNLHHRIAIDPASITTLDLWRPRAAKVLRMNETPGP